ncbi:MAG TPA: hypothetical protein PKA29_01830 [Candidatus Saccharibacteria bacterium]|nr:hypothetical protein [Candidatus Saccharibacteria bacterium]
MAQTALGVFGQVVYIVFALPKRYGQHKLALTGVLKPKCRKLQGLQVRLVKQIDNLSAVYGVSSKSIGVPRNYAICLAIFYAFQHIAKNLSAWHFGGLFLYQFVHYLQVFIFSVCSQLYELRLNGQHLFVLNIGTLASIDKVFLLALHSVYPPSQLK